MGSLDCTATLPPRKVYTDTAYMYALRVPVQVHVVVRYGTGIYLYNRYRYLDYLVPVYTWYWYSIPTGSTYLVEMCSLLLRGA